MKKFVGCWDWLQSLGKVVSGMDAVCGEIQKHKAKLVIIAKDTSEKSKKKVKYVCDNNRTRVIELSTIDILSEAIGKKNKAIICITDENFSDGILKKCNRG